MTDVRALLCLLLRGKAVACMLMLHQCSNGDRYKGDWLNGKRHGRGRIGYSNGDHYTGAWADDVYQGNGSLVLSSKGIWYEGLFVNGTPSLRPTKLNVFWYGSCWRACSSSTRNAQSQHMSGFVRSNVNTGWILPPRLTPLTHPRSPAHLAKQQQLPPMQQQLHLRLLQCCRCADAPWHGFMHTSCARRCQCTKHCDPNACGGLHASLLAEHARLSAPGASGCRCSAGTTVGSRTCSALAASAANVSHRQRRTGCRIHA
jgi:hypothetical protein